MHLRLLLASQALAQRLRPCAVCPTTENRPCAAARRRGGDVGDEGFFVERCHGPLGRGRLFRRVCAGRRQPGPGRCLAKLQLHSDRCPQAVGWEAIGISTTSLRWRSPRAVAWCRRFGCARVGTPRSGRPGTASWRRTTIWGFAAPSGWRCSAGRRGVQGRGAEALAGLAAGAAVPASAPDCRQHAISGFAGLPGSEPGDAGSGPFGAAKALGGLDEQASWGCGSASQPVRVPVGGAGVP